MAQVSLRDPADARVAVVDYGMGNLRSVGKIVSRTGADVRVSSDVADLEWATHLILPGVGAFPDAMRELNRRGLVEALGRIVREKGKPILGICLGMQLLCRFSPEVVDTQGLGWIAADMVPFPKSSGLRVPHIGWNQLQVKSADPLVEGIADGSFFYFVHSLHMVCDRAQDVLATSSYGDEFVAAVRSGNVRGTQFHPEKSQANGFRMLLNYVTEVE
ncbi:imidazole glycerol phosphate synthase subunit HisH [Ferrovibrio sp.]|uniref:imidazole glycerol phosphate synthase subunit HisH n=1 Tax=Ferrovibrio sp. TaxID=1917215 RepID=UPI0035B05DFC